MLDKFEINTCVSHQGYPHDIFGGRGIVPPPTGWGTSWKGGQGVLGRDKGRGEYHVI